MTLLFGVLLKTDPESGVLGGDSGLGMENFSGVQHRGTNHVSRLGVHIYVAILKTVMA